MNDIYQAPMAPLGPNEPSKHNQGSLERAIQGNYVLVITDIIKESWVKTKGAKWTIHLALFFYMIIYLAAAIGIPFMVGLMNGPREDSPLGLMISSIASILAAVVSLPTGVGLFMIGLRRAANEPIAAATVFEYFHKTGALFITMLIMYVMLIIGFLLLIIPGIYLSVCYYFALPLVAEKGLSPWQALETSRKAVSKHWFSVFGFFIAIALLVIIAILPLGIGLIWVIPMTLIAYGSLYRTIFGYSQ